MRLFEIHKTPFPHSVDPRILYHGTVASFSKFCRDNHGIYVTPIRSWAEEHYGDRIIPLYANITKQKILTWDHEESDWFYDRDYSRVGIYLDELSSLGYDCVRFGGESESMVLFNQIEIVHAETLQPM